MKRVLSTLALALTLALAGCTESTGAGDETGGPASQGTPSQQSSARTSEISRESETAKAEECIMKVSIDGTDVTVEWEENESVAALAKLAADGPLTIQMSMYGGFEQVGSLGELKSKVQRRCV